MPRRNLNGNFCNNIEIEKTINQQPSLSYPFPIKAQLRLCFFCSSTEK